MKETNNFFSLIGSAAERFSLSEHLLLFFSILVFVFSKTIIMRFNSKTDKSKQIRQLKMLRVFSFMFACFYVVGFFIDAKWSKHLGLISETAITFLVTYLAAHFFGVWSLNNYGKERGDKKRHTYASEIVSLSGTIVFGVIGLVAVIEIWGLESLLETTSVLGVVALLVFTTKDFWLGEAVACLQLLYHNKIKTGTVVRIKSQNFVGVIEDINLTQTSVKHLVRKNEIVTLPNSFFLKERVDIIRCSDSDDASVYAYIDFKIGYGTPRDNIERYFDAILKAGEEKYSSIGRSKNEMVLVENGDHAVKWRLNYHLSNAYELISVENYLNMIAYDLQNEYEIDISTPFTHTVKGIRSMSQAEYA